MTQRLKNRIDLKFSERKNCPDPIEFDYAKEITQEDMTVLDRAMMHRAKIDGAKLHNALNKGIIISGEEW